MGCIEARARRWAGGDSKADSEASTVTRSSESVQLILRVSQCRRPGVATATARDSPDSVTFSEVSDRDRRRPVTTGCGRRRLRVRGRGRFKSDRRDCDYQAESWQ